MNVISNNLELIILDYLRCEDVYGYELVKILNSNFEMNIKEVSIYTVVRRLEKKEHITFYWSDENIGVRRKYYKITLAGLAYLEEYKRKWLYQMNMIKKYLEENDDKGNS